MSITPPFFRSRWTAGRSRRSAAIFAGLVACTAIAGCQPQIPGALGASGDPSAEPSISATHKHEPAPSQPAASPVDSPVASAGSASPSAAGAMAGMDMSLAPKIDTSVPFPVGYTGDTQKRVTTLNPDLAASYNDGVGAFRFDCQYSHMAFDDPIVAPGQPGASHLHTFAGNSDTNANSTPESIATTGGSTCRGGTANRSAYWVPSLIDTNTHLPLKPTRFLLYYKSGYHGVDPSQINAAPKGLRMIAGSAKATGPQEPSDAAFWRCEATSERSASIPQNCTGTLTMGIVFPQCWNGKDLDSPDHKSHMAYGIWQKGCPADFPVAIPEITYGVSYEIPPGGTGSLRLASDAYSASDPGGYSAHGDWMNGWDETVMKTFVDNCLKTGMDCHMDNLGDGTMLETVPEQTASATP